MPGNSNYNGTGDNTDPNNNHIPGRVERLLKQRELRKSGRGNNIHLNEAAAIDSNGRNSSSSSSSSSSEALLLEQEQQQQRLLLLREEYENGSGGGGDVVEGGGRKKGCERQQQQQEVVVGNGKGYRQRLLVVANRLPVSAIRKGEDSWSLEISAGGLVSALLGNFSFSSPVIFFFFRLKY